MTTAAEKLAAKKAERDAKRKDLEEAKAEQELIDLEGLEAAETEHGVGKVGQVEVKYTPGLPTLIVVRTPREPEIKRFRSMARGENGQVADKLQAQIDIADMCRVYPDKETYDRICSDYPVLKAMVSEVALMLAGGQVELRAKF